MTEQSESRPRDVKAANPSMNLEPDRPAHAFQPKLGGRQVVQQPDNDGNRGHQYNLPQPPYTVFTHREKASTIVLVSILAMMSPLSSTTFLPALTSIAEDLDVSISAVNLTVTTYLVSFKLLQSIELQISQIADLTRNCTVFHREFLRFVWA